METTTVVPSITEEEMASLTQSILVRYGIDFTCYEPKSLRRRIIRVMNIFKTNSVHELWVKFLRDQQFIQVFMNEVSVGMTSMFRDPIMWKKLKTIITERFAEKREISIWHAGCSTGEEVYSMGILLKESGVKSYVHGTATDINRDAMAIAQQGNYHKIKMIENERNYKEFNPRGNFSQYYTTQGASATMDPALINYAKFAYNNLITDSPSQRYDIIFCRNVMIYFDNQAKRKLLQKFHQALNPDGLFIIGFYDTMLSLIDGQLFTLHNEETKIFSRTKGIL